MKKRLITIFTLLCVVFLQAGCRNDSVPDDETTLHENTDMILGQIDNPDEHSASVKVAGQAVTLCQVDASKDVLISRKVDEDVDTVVEKGIFLPLLENENKVTAVYGDVIEIEFSGEPDSAVLYDHLLREDGTSYFGRSITEHTLVIQNQKAAVELSWHISAALSSQSDFLKDGSIRGFRLVTKTGDNVEEYAFVIYTK